MNRAWPHRGSIDRVAGLGLLGWVFVFFSFSDVAGQDANPAAASSPEQLAAEMLHLRSDWENIHSEGTFTTETYGGEWKISTSGRFELVNFNGQFLFKTELDHLRINGAPPDYLREVSLQMATLDLGVGGLHGRASFAFRRAVPAVKITKQGLREIVSARHPLCFSVLNGHPLLSGRARDDEPIVASSLFPQAIIDLTTASEQQEDQSFVATETIDDDRSLKFTIVAEDHSRYCTLQTIAQETNEVRKETAISWQQLPDHAMPLQWSTRLRHNPSWNFDAQLSFENFEKISQVAENQFELSSMMFESMTFTEEDPPQLIKTYQLLKQLNRQDVVPNVR